MSGQMMTQHRPDIAWYPVTPIDQDLRAKSARKAFAAAWYERVRCIDSPFLQEGRACPTASACRTHRPPVQEISQ